MNSIPKFIASVVIFLIAVLVCVSIIFAGVMTAAARMHHNTIMSKIEESNFDSDVINECIQNVEKKGFLVDVTKESNVSSVEYYKVTLWYDLQLPLFGKVHTGKILGYAYPGASVGATADHYFEIDNKGVLGIKATYRWATGLDDYASDNGKDNPGSKNDLLPTEIVIPTYFDGIKVKELRDNIFANNTSLTKISFEEGVEKIGVRAFENCTGITEIAFPDSMKENGYASLQGCNNLISFKAPFAGGDILDADHSYIGYLFGVEVDDYSYKENNLVVPQTLTKVELTKYVAYYSLYDLDSLTELIIGEDVTEFEPWPFAYCDGLTTVTIPKNVQKTHYGAFSNCKNLEKVVFEEGSQLTILGHSNFEDCPKLTTIKLPTTVKEIGSYCFENCDALTFSSYETGMLPEGVQIIKNGAYKDSDGYQTFIIPASVTTVEPNAFTRSKSLEAIQVASENESFCVGVAGELLTIDKTEIVAYPYAGPTSYVVPETVTIIREDAFWYSEKLLSVDFSQATKLQTIDDSAFCQCPKIEGSISLPESVTFIGSYAFYHSGKWSDFWIGPNVSYVGKYAFYDAGSSVGKTYFLTETAPTIDDGAFLTNTLSNGTPTPTYVVYVKNDNVKSAFISDKNYRPDYTNLFVDSTIAYGVTK